MFCFSCGQRATTTVTCANNCGYSRDLCKAHADQTGNCPNCNSPVTRSPMREDPPPPDSVNQLAKKSKTDSKQEMVEEPKLPSPGAMVLGCQAKKTTHTSEMAVKITIGNGMEAREVILGHSFHAMRAAEKELRAQCGIRVSGESTSGMNIALMELRALLVDSEGKVYEIVIQLCDQFSRNILLCSTGGIVLTEKAEITRLEELKQKQAAKDNELLVLDELTKRDQASDKLVRCCASQNAYAGSKIFAFCGAYSFFNSGGQTSHDLKIAADSHQATHDGAYRKLVCGPPNNQLFHHSEQTGFKLLYENPELLVKALRKCLGDELLSTVKLRLAAVAIDLFTTRSACFGCMDGSAAVLSSGHFFEKALLKLGEAFPQTVVTKDVLKIVRIDCETPFQKLHSPQLTDGILLHGHPRQQQGVMPAQTNTLKICRLEIMCNANDNPLLEFGSQKCYSPPILKKINEQLQLEDSPKTLDSLIYLIGKYLEIFKTDFYSGVVMTSDLINKFARGNNLSPVEMQLRLTGQWKDPETVALAAKYHCFLNILKTKFETDISNDTYPCSVVACASFHFGAIEFGRTFMRAYSMAYRDVFDKTITNQLMGDVYDNSRKMMFGVIKELVEKDDPAAESFARRLALHYNLLAEYKSLFEEKK